MRIALITGASSGLGREYARWASDHGDYDQIWAVARRRERLEKLASELSTPVRLVPLDLTDKASITQLKVLLDEAAAQDKARGEKFSVGLLVNAAGLGKFGTYADMTCEEVDTMADLNCRALVDVTQVALAHMERGGRIIQIASSASFQPLPGLNVYAASKAFVRSYTRALRFELRGRGIFVTAVCPLWVKTEFIDVARQTANAPRGALVDAGKRRELPHCHMLRDGASHEDCRQDHPRACDHVDLGGRAEDLDAGASPKCRRILR